MCGEGRDEGGDTFLIRASPKGDGEAGTSVAGECQATVRAAYWTVEGIDSLRLLFLGDESGFEAEPRGEVARRNRFSVVSG